MNSSGTGAASHGGMQLRESGLEAVGSIPWGTHFCQFYTSNADLIETLVPYLKAGLEANEFCMWLTSETLDSREAEAALRRAMPELNRYFAAGQVEIANCGQWISLGGRADVQKVIASWASKLEMARGLGFEGLRVASDVVWDASAGWNGVIGYEAEFDSSIRSQRVLALCTFPLERCKTNEVLDIAAKHEFALIRNGADWRVLENTGRRKMEREFRKFASLADNSTEFIGMSDMNFIPFYINEAGKQLVGLGNARQFSQTPVKDFFFPEDQDFILNEFFPRVLREGRAEVEIRFRHFKTGEPIWMIYNVFLLKGDHGEPIGLATVSRNITARKRAEEALRESETQLRHLSDSLPDSAVYRYGREADGTPRFYYISAGIEQLNGVRIEDVLRDADLLHRQILPEYFAKLVEAEQRSASELSDFQMEVPMRRPDGEHRWMRLQSRPQRLPDGRVVWDGVQTDITGLKRLEEQLRRSEALLRTATDHAGVGLVLIGRDRRYLFANPAYSAILGLTGDLVGKGPAEVLPEVYKDQISPQLDQAFAGQRVTYELIKPQAEGEPRYFTVIYELLRSDEGEVTHVIVVIYDITAPKLAALHISESEERLSAIVRTAIDAIIVIDEEGRIQSINPAGERMFGYRASELAGQNVSMLMPEPHRSLHDAYLSSYRRTGEGKIIGVGREVQARRKGGSLFAADLAVTEWRAGGRRFFTGLVRDITERKQRDEKIQLLLREVNHRSKNMLSLVQAIASQTVAAEPVEFVNRFSERIQALAASQDLLIKSQWRGISMEDLVTSQLAHFRDLLGDRIKLTGSPVRVAAPAAQSIGMALHELATNAGKYGALANSSGEVAITWRLDGTEAGDGRFSLSWIETGGPAVTAPPRRGFGSIVVETMPRMELDADVALVYAPEGLRWRLQCEAKRVFEAGSEVDFERHGP